MSCAPPARRRPEPVSTRRRLARGRTAVSNRRAMAAVEAHVSSCARCQALVGAMVAHRTPGTSSGTERTPGTLSLWKWWLAPIAAGATAVTLWMVVPEEPRLATSPPQREAANTAPTPAAAEALPPAAPPRDAAIEKPADQLARRDNKVAGTAREDRQSTFAEATVDRQEKPSEERKEEVAALEERAKLADTAAPAAAAAPPPAATATLQAPAEFGALRKSARTIVAPPGIEVTHQSAPSDSVCWFVGRAGLVAADHRRRSDLHAG